MKLLDTESRKMALLFKKSVDDFVMMEGLGNPDWDGDFRCEWTDFSAEIAKGGEEWIMTIDGVRLVWCHPVDPSDPGVAIAWMTGRLCRFVQADTTARRLMGP